MDRVIKLAREKERCAKDDQDEAGLVSSLLCYYARAYVTFFPLRPSLCSTFCSMLSYRF